MLHITNGDSTRLGLEPSGVPGTFSSWSDVFHYGPTPAGLSPREMRRLRARYMASLGYGSEAGILEQCEREDDALESWRDHDEVVFWFEHDLYDQLILIRQLSWMKDVGATGAGATGADRATRFSLVCGDTYLGPLKPEAFPALFAQRVPVSAEQIRLGSEAWSAFCADDPRAIEAFARREVPALPYLSGALRRHFEDYPWVGDGVSRSERQILQVVAGGATRPHEMFRRWTGMEERIFMGDLTFWTIARTLASGRTPLLSLDTGRFEQHLPDGTASITSAGEDVLAGRADHVQLNGIDRWMGGVHLVSERLWRWAPEQASLIDQR